jgi:hypothetical protein
MTKPDLTDEDYSNLAKLVREAIVAEQCGGGGSGGGWEGVGFRIGATFLGISAG